MGNELVPVDGLKHECVVLAKVQGVSEGSANVKFLKTLCLRGSIIHHAASKDGRSIRQRLEDCHASAQSLFVEFKGKRVTLDTAISLLEKAGVRGIEKESLFLSMRVVKKSLLNKNGEVLRTYETFPGMNARRPKMNGATSLRSEVVSKMFAVRMIVIPESASQVLRWHVKKMEDERVWRDSWSRMRWKDERDSFLALAETIEFLAAKKNKDGMTMDELVSKDLTRLREMMKTGALEGDGWKVQQNDYDWLLGRRGRRDSDEEHH